jgi:superfamily I DNA/RNA helicase
MPCKPTSAAPQRSSEPWDFVPDRDGYPNGPDRLILLGPPGTGKTHAAVEHFVLPALAPTLESMVLACSFTRAAAEELRGRLAADQGGVASDYRLTASTVHAEACRLLLAERSELRVIGADGVLTDAVSDFDRLPSAALGSSEQPYAEIKDLRRRAALRVWDLARNRREPTDVRRAYLEVQPADYTLQEVLAEITAYEAEKREQEAIDFVDMLVLALRVDPPLRELVLVDEVQDSTPLQWALFERWGASARRFALVGDVDQSVHRWCGASPSRLLELTRSFGVRQLRRGRRVPRRQHQLATALIRRNRYRVETTFSPTAFEGSVEDVGLEQGVAEVIEAEQEGCRTLVLARSREVLRRYSRALAESAAPFVHERGYSPLNELLVRQIALGLIHWSSGQAVEPDVALEILGRLPSCDFFPSGKKHEILAEVEGCSTPVGVDFVASLGTNMGGLTAGNLFDQLLRVRIAPSPTLRARLAADLALLVETHGPPVLEREPCVTLTTIHGAKGREARLVVLDLEAPRLVFESFADPSAIETERQVLYVGLTRSSDRLLLVRHPRRDLGAELGLGEAL